MTGRGTVPDPHGACSVLAGVLESLEPVAIAVSGGVDSLTLAAFAGVLKLDALVLHAASPAVPREATERVRVLARDRGWALRVIDAGEFRDERYRSNPANRCLFCKTNLYTSMARVDDRRALVSGTNTDDLGDWRPGLEAARAAGVRHPFVEADMFKRDVRALARRLGMPDVATLPASPCLSSRIETGLRVEPADLATIDEIEATLRGAFELQTVRCRRRARGWVIEVEGADPGEREAIGAVASAALARHGTEASVSIETYRMGSAFLRGDAT